MPVLFTLPGSASGRNVPVSRRAALPARRVPRGARSQPGQQDASRHQCERLRGERRRVHLGPGEEAAQPVGLALAEQSAPKSL